MDYSPGVVFNRLSDILNQRSLVVRQTDPKLAFPTYLRGSDTFDEDWTNLTVMNNVVVTSACWGIGYASLHRGNRAALSASLLLTRPAEPSRSCAESSAASRSIRTSSLFLRVCVDGRGWLDPIGQTAEKNTGSVQLRQNERAPVFREKIAEGDRYRPCERRSDHVERKIGA
jgi:hypothetical protein